MATSPQELRAVPVADKLLLDTDRAFALAQIALYTALGGGWSPNAPAPLPPRASADAAASEANTPLVRSSSAAAAKAVLVAVSVARPSRAMAAQS